MTSLNRLIVISQRISREMEDEHQNVVGSPFQESIHLLLINQQFFRFLWGPNRFV